MAVCPCQGLTITKLIVCVHSSAGLIILDYICTTGTT